MSKSTNYIEGEIGPVEIEIIDSTDDCLSSEEVDPDDYNDPESFCGDCEELRVYCECDKWCDNCGDLAEQCEHS